MLFVSRDCKNLVQMYVTVIYHKMYMYKIVSHCKVVYNMFNMYKNVDITIKTSAYPIENSMIFQFAKNSLNFIFNIL